MSEPSWLSDSHDEPTPQPPPPPSTAQASQEHSWASPEEDVEQGGNVNQSGAPNKEIEPKILIGQFCMNIGMAVFVMATGVFAMIFSTGKFSFFPCPAATSVRDNLIF